MTKRSELIWEREVVDPVLVPGSTQFEHLSQVDFIEKFKLEEPVECVLYRFVTFERTFKPWFPSARLTIEPLGSPFAFWKGREQEVADAKARAAAAERRRSRRENKTKRPISPQGPEDKGVGTRQPPKPPQEFDLPALEDESHSEDEVGEKAPEHRDLQGFWSCLDDGPHGAETELGVLQDICGLLDGEQLRELPNQELGNPVQPKSREPGTHEDDDGQDSVIAPGPETPPWYYMSPGTPPICEPSPPPPDPEPEDIGWFDELMGAPAPPPNSGHVDGVASPCSRQGFGDGLDDVPLAFYECPWLAPYPPDLEPQDPPAGGPGDLPMSLAESGNDASGPLSGSGEERPPPVEPPDPPGCAAAAGGGFRAPSAIDERDSLQPPGCTLRKYRSRDGICYWEGRGPRPQRLSRSRHITASRSEEEILGEIEAWLLTNFGQLQT